MTVVIPAYKPDEKLLGVLKRLKEMNVFHLLVVNDGSGEPYEKIFRQVEEMGCTLLRHRENQGKGAALKTALRYLQEKGEAGEIICTADADGQHLPEDIFRCSQEAQNHPDCLILGCRSFRGDVPFRSRFGNTITRWSFRFLMGASVWDTQTGLRAFSTEMIPAMLSVEANRYEYEMQVLCNAVKNRVTIRQVEIQTVYLDENSSSHFHPLRDALRVYGLLLQNACSRIYQLFSFLFSSGIAFLTDLVLYTLCFNYLFPSLFANTELLALFSLLAARISSSLVNYFINRKVVFHSGNRVGKTLIMYSALVVLIFLLNHELNTLFLIRFSCHEIPSLIFAQVLCFPISFLIQKFLIFPDKKVKK